MLHDPHGIPRCKNLTVPTKPEILQNGTTVDQNTAAERGASFCCVVD